MGKGALPEGLDLPGVRISSLRSGEAELLEKLHRRLIDVGVVLLAGIAGLSFVQIVCRYVLGISVPWSNDMTQIMMMWMVMMTAGAMVWRGSHFALQFILDLFPAAVQRQLRVLIGLFIWAFAIFLMITGTRLAISQSNQLVPALGITYLYVYLAMPIGAFFILVFAAGDTWRQFTRKEGKPAATGEPS